MTTISKIQEYVFDAIEKRMLLFASLLITILVITYFKPDHKVVANNGASISISISKADLSSMPRFFLKN
jgi:hypothetical protein